MRVILILIFTAILWSCKKEPVSPQSVWIENIGSKKTVPLLPDSNVNYFLYSFTRHKGDSIGIRIKGQFGYARYMSYNVYDNNTLSSIGSLVDRFIVPDVGSDNPYHPTANPNLANRDYTINICPNSIDSGVYSNLLLYDDQLENIGIILRYYIPQQNNYAKVPLPSIEAFNIRTGASIAMPAPSTTNFQQQFQEKYEKINTLLNLAGLLEQPKDIFFYKFSGAFLYPNLDNYYLFTPITFNKNGVVMLRFKAPTFALNNTQNSSADVRYFSICLSDAKTYTYSTTTDLQFKIAADGFINIVIATDDAALRARANGLNFVVLPPELRDNVKGVIVYRNLLTNPDFPYPMRLVPDITNNINISTILSLSTLQAQTYLNAYAPVGRRMSKGAYLNNFDGFPVSY